MPYKDPEIRRIKGAAYQRNFRANMTSEERDLYKKKDAMSSRKWYNSLSPEEKEVYRTRHNAQLREKYATSASTRLRIKETAFIQYRQKREAVIVHLGGRCAGLNCLWINTDGSRGCIDSRCLQIDHVKSNGAELRKNASEWGTVFYRKVLKTIPGEEYQLLCANCNWIKRAEKGELPQPRATANSYVFIDKRKSRPKDSLGRFAAAGA